MRFAKRFGRPKPRRSVRSQRQFEQLEDRRLMAVVIGQSTFSASLMGDNIELMSDGNAVGYGYAVSYQGNPVAAVGGDGQARTADDDPAEGFSSLTEMDISSVSKTVTATAILQILQSQPGGLDAALSTPLADYLPSDWTPGENVQSVTLRHLLTHRSGFQSAAADNNINVNFGAPTNATYANLKSLVEADLPEPDVDFEPTYHGPRWFSSYNNANFALLARVVLPKLTNPGINLTAANYVDRDLTSGTIYKEYVQDEIFEPLGIFGADLDVTDPYPTMGYLLGVDEPGEAPIDRTRTGGAGGWKMDARELARFLDGIQRDDSILSAATRQMRNDQELGWSQTENAFGDSFGHNGANGDADVGLFRSQIIAMPGEVEVAYLMNSEWGNLPGGNIFNMLQTAYVNAWTDLTVSGTTGDDDFILRLDNSGFLPAVQVELNGEVLFEHWISTLDSLTLNGGIGNDTFTILGWNSSIDLNINGSFGDDVVSVLPGVRNIDAVNGMTFSGGSGADRIVVNDQNNSYSNAVMSRMYTVTESSVARFIQNPVFPGNLGMFLPVIVNFSGVEDLDLNSGGQNDVVSVVSQTSGDTRIFTGNGDDVIVVAQAAGNLEAVDGLEVDGQAGIDEIRLYDHNKTSADPQATAQYDVDADSVSRYMASLGGILNGPPVSVGVEYNNVESLQLTTTDLVDVIRVHQAPTGATTINAGAGNDSLIASPNGRNLELVDDLTFNGDAGLDEIVLNDQSNPYSAGSLSGEYDVTAAGVSRSAAMGGGMILIPVTINVATSSVEDLTLRTGGEDDLVNVQSTPSAGATIQTGAGDDVVHASQTAANIETVNGLQVEGGAGADALHIHDVNNPYELPGGADYTITPATVGRFAEHVLFDDFVVPVELGFTDVESVSLAAGNQQDRFEVEGEGGAAAVTLDGNGGADQFHVTSPAFASMSIQGDAPIFFPGDQLVVNENGLYAVATIPGLYPQGAGGVSIDSMTISYTGIDQTSVHPQIYGGPGDFDSNGVVNGQDLTHGTLGWNARFGDDLEGGDFLTWQRHLGENRLPRGGAGSAAAATDEIAEAPAEPAGDEKSVYSLMGMPPSSDADESHQTIALAYDGAMQWSPASTPSLAESFASRELAFEAYPTGGASDDEDETESAPTDWDAAFADFGPALILDV